MRTKLLVGGVLLSIGFAMLATDAEAGWRRRARNGCCQPAVAACQFQAPACGFQGGCAPATAYATQNVYGAQTACAVPAGYQTFGYQTFGPNGAAGTYGSAGHYPQPGQGIQQTGAFQPAPPPREIDDNQQ